MKRWGLRASSLSAVTNVDAGQNDLSNHLTPQCFIHDVTAWCFIINYLKSLLYHDFIQNLYFYVVLISIGTSIIFLTVVYN
jgi:hypothetical protein